MRAWHDTEPTSFKTDAWFLDPLGPINLDLRASAHLAILECLSAQTRARIFTHISFNKEDNYEDLEYLGDSVLQVVATVFLDERYPNLSKSENNTIRLRIIGKITLSQISVALGLQTRIRTGPALLYPAQGIMEDVVEALLGGIYRDQGLDESKLSPRSATSPSASSSSLPTSHRPSRRIPATADHSKDELTRVCTALRLNVCYEAVSRVRMPDGGSIWTERVKVGDGRYQAEGRGWTMKSAQNMAAAEVLEERELAGVPKKAKRARLR